MTPALPLRAALKRGALVTAANWPVVFVDFTLESLYKFAVGVPVIGGAFMVRVLLGSDVHTVFDEGLRSAADLVMGAFGSSPAALTAFLFAVAFVALGGALIMFPIKAGTLAILAAGERRAGDIERPPLRLDAIRRAHAYDLGAFVAAVQRFARRAVTLAVWLGLAYAAVGILWVGAVALSLQLAGDPRWAGAWPLIVLIATSAAIIAVTAINLACDLLRVIVVTDDCAVRVAARRLRTFFIADTRQVLGIFAIISILMLIALAIAVPLAASLTFVAWVPVVGLLAAPLQIVGWLIRGLVFQYMGLTALSAYQTQYRRFAEPDSRVAAPRLVQHA